MGQLIALVLSDNWVGQLSFTVITQVTSPVLPQLAYTMQQAARSGPVFLLSCPWVAHPHLPHQSQLHHFSQARYKAHSRNCCAGVIKEEEEDQLSCSHAISAGLPILLPTRSRSIVLSRKGAELLSQVLQLVRDSVGSPTHGYWKGRGRSSLPPHAPTW